MANTNTSSQSYPAVSVVIPMYNAEKYLGECLESILNQTFQDYEVILVNDCTTDCSRQVAELYLEKFGGRLKIFDNEKNSGPGTTRNNGLLKATGEYVFFMDSDDMILTNALEDFYETAKKNNADVVFCPHNYDMSSNGKDLIPQIYYPNLHAKDIVEDDFKWRVDMLLAKGNMSYTPWRKFSKRIFLMENNLFFREGLNVYEDRIWSYGLYLCAKRAVHLAKPYYLYRMSANSLLRAKKTPAREITENFLAIFEGMKWISNIMNEIDYIQKNPQFRYKILSTYLRGFYSRIYHNSLKVNQFEIYEAIIDHFGKKLGDQDVLISTLFTYISAQQKKIREIEKQLKEKEV